MDLGLSPCVCGILGPTPKPKSTQSPHVQSLAKGPSTRLKAHDSKGKAPMGFGGCRPKYAFKPKLRLLGSHIKKATGLGPKKATGLGQPCDPGESTSAGGSTTTWQLLEATLATIPCESSPSTTLAGLIDKLQPRPEEGEE